MGGAVSGRRWVACGWRFVRMGALALVVFVLTVALCRWLPPPVSSLMLQRWVTARWRGDFSFHLQYRWVGLANVSPAMALAVVAAEDQKFPAHHGFDYQAINRALRDNEHRALPRGASTISQQVAKNLFLWPGRSFVRKGLEVLVTALLEGLWPKRRILEVYLNIVEFGPGIFGVETASAVYFGKPPRQLREFEAARLAAVLPNPHLLHADHPSAYVLKRSFAIRRQMELLGGTDYLAKTLEP